MLVVVRKEYVPVPFHDVVFQRRRVDTIDRGQLQLTVLLHEDLGRKRGSHDERGGGG
jgi:hypothetical protein